MKLTRQHLALMTLELDHVTELTKTLSDQLREVALHDSCATCPHQPKNTEGPTTGRTLDT